MSLLQYASQDPMTLYVDAAAYRLLASSSNAFAQSTPLPDLVDQLHGSDRVKKQLTVRTRKHNYLEAAQALVALFVL